MPTPAVSSRSIRASGRDTDSLHHRIDLADSQMEGRQNFHVCRAFSAEKILQAVVWCFAGQARANIARFVVSVGDDGATSVVGGMRNFLADRLSRYKHPESFEIVDVGPRDDSGKVRRTLLRDECAAWLQQGRAFRIVPLRDSAKRD